MDEQIDKINLYADSIAAMDNVDWELKIRKAVEANSAEAKAEKRLKEICGESETASESEAETKAQTKTSRYARNGRMYYNFRPSTTNLLLAIIAFLLLLNLIFTK